jgi:hypothetical protein
VKDYPQKIDVAGQKIDVDFYQRDLGACRIWKRYKNEETKKKRREEDDTERCDGVVEKNALSIF